MRNSTATDTRAAAAAAAAGATHARRCSDGRAPVPWMGMDGAGSWMRACWLHGQQSLAFASLLTAIRLLAAVLFRCRRCSFARCSTFASLARIRCSSMRAAVDRIAMLSATSRRCRRRRPSPPSLPSPALIRRPCECGGFARAGRGCQLPRCTEPHAAASRCGKGTQCRRAAADPTGSRPLAARPGRTHTAVRTTTHRRRQRCAPRGLSAGGAAQSDCVQALTDRPPLH